MDLVALEGDMVLGDVVPLLDVDLLRACPRLHSHHLLEVGPVEEEVSGAMVKKRGRRGECAEARRSATRRAGGQGHHFWMWIFSGFVPVYAATSFLSLGRWRRR